MRASVLALAALACGACAADVTPWAGPPAGMFVLGDDGVQPLTTWGWTDCSASARARALTAGEADDAGRLNTLRVDPDPPVPGQKMTVDLSGSLSETVTVRAAAQGTPP